MDEVQASDSALDRSWARGRLATWVREAIICGFCDAVVRSYSVRRLMGVENLARLPGPAILVSNHCSHVDTPILLRALPGPLRRKTVIAAATDYFYGSRFLAAVVSLSFSTIPLQRRGGAVPGAAAAVRNAIEDGWSIVIFPEGTRSRDGRVGVLRTGAAVLAREHRIPIVPVYISGTHDAMPVGSRWLEGPKGWPLRRHVITIKFGEPIEVGPDSDRFKVMEQVREFMADNGARTTEDPKLARRAKASGRTTTGP